jgi:hypothetical protein
VSFIGGIFVGELAISISTLTSYRPGLSFDGLRGDDRRRQRDDSDEDE